MYQMARHLILSWVTAIFSARCHTAVSELQQLGRWEKELERGFGHSLEPEKRKLQCCLDSLTTRVLKSPYRTFLWFYKLLVAWLG